MNSVISNYILMNKIYELFAFYVYNIKIKV